MTSTIINSLQSAVPASLDALDPLGLEPLQEDTRQRFLRFRLADDNSALLPLENILEVLQIEPVEILPVPQMPVHLLGVCNCRGRILWLVDLNQLVGYAPLWHRMPQLESPVVIVVESGNRSVGLVVEQVDDLELIAAESLHLPTELDSAAVAPFVMSYLPNHEGTVLDTDVIVESALGEPP